MKSFAKSNALFQKAQRIIPGGVNSPVRSFKGVGGNPIYFQSAKGPYLYDVDGNEYIDFCLSFGPHIAGHCHPEVLSAISEQLREATSFGACHPKEVEIAEWILKGYPFLGSVRLVNSGTEAVMTAIRVARGKTKRNKILKFEGCYHGHSDGLLAKAGSSVAELSESSSNGVPESVVGDTISVRLDSQNEIQKAFELYGQDIAAVIIEPLPANYGLRIPVPAELENICMLARQNGSLIIFDEVISGFRVGLSGACGIYDLRPDLVTLGKIIGGGLPLAAIVGKKEVMEVLAPVGEVYQAGTLSGNPLAVAAGIATLKLLFSNPPYTALEKTTKKFCFELQKILGNKAELLQVGSLFWFNFERSTNAFPPVLTPEGKEKYSQLFHKLLNEGVYLPPSPYEVCFTSIMHDETVLQRTLEKFEKCLS